MKRNFYGAYNHIESEIFIFPNKAKRDSWVNDPSAIFPRCAINRDEARIMSGRNLKQAIFDEDFSCGIAENRGT